MSELTAGFRVTFPVLRVPPRASGGLSTRVLDGPSASFRWVVRVMRTHPSPGIWFSLAGGAGAAGGFAAGCQGDGGSAADEDDEDDGDDDGGGGSA